MLGPEGAAERVRSWLEPGIARRLRLLELRLGLAAGELADPVNVLAHEAGPLGLEDWPSVYVLPQRTAGMVPVETATDDGGEVWRITYTLRVLAWVRAEDYATTDLLRMRYALAIREALLERKQLSDVGVVDADAFTINPGSIREDYGPVMVDDAKRTISGVYLDVDVLVVEDLAGPAALGTADTLEVTATPLAPHPGL